MDTPPSPPRFTLRGLLLLPLRVALGAFVLWQALFLVGYNLINTDRDIRDSLTVERSRESFVWETISAHPRVGNLVRDWIDRDEQSKLGQGIGAVKKVMNSWAKKAGQEQGWGLFAPNTTDRICFVALELRWDDDPVPLGARPKNLAPLALAGVGAYRLREAVQESVPPPLILYSENEPRDHRRYLRVGGFRVRKYESQLETYMTLDGRSREECLADWEDVAERKYNRESKEILAYMRWRLRKFQAEHPGLPDPRQIILRTRVWIVPPPPGPEPFEWLDPVDEPVLRWRPRPPLHLAEPGDLELYQHRRGCFEDKLPK